MKLLKKGDRIRLKVRTMAGWKGTGTVMEDQITADGGVRFIKDGAEPGTLEYEIGCDACRHEVEVLRSNIL